MGSHVCDRLGQSREDLAFLLRALLERVERSEAGADERHSTVDGVDRANRDSLRFDRNGIGIDEADDGSSSLIDEDELYGDR